MEINPFASPQSTGEPPADPAESVAWRYDDLLVVRDNVVLPARCVKCNAPTDLTVRRMRLHWYPPVAYVGVLLGVLPFFLIVLATGKTLTIYVGLCQAHRRRRRLGIIAGMSITAIAVALIFTAVHFETGPGLFAAVMFLFGALIAWAFMARTIWPQRIEKRFAKIKGVCPEFLDTLPEGPL